MLLLTEGHLNGLSGLIHFVCFKSNNPERTACVQRCGLLGSVHAKETPFGWKSKQDDIYLLHEAILSLLQIRD